MHTGSEERRGEKGGVIRKRREERTQDMRGDR